MLHNEVASSEKAGPDWGEARLTAYEAFCGIAAKYEAPQMRYEAKPFQASCFLPIRAKNGISNGSFSEVHLTLKSYCFSAFLPEVWHSVAHHDLICDIRILGKKWGKSALYGKNGEVFVY